MTTGELTKIIEKYEYPIEEKRNYIGASSIGSDCLRQIWYEFTGQEGDRPLLRLKRTWDIGKKLESYIIELLQDAGITIHQDQLEVSDYELPYFKGHIDGYLIDLEAILEIKTANDASFNLFKKNGLKKWNPKYYAQLQAYMGMNNLYKAYILVLNKDNSDIWDELVAFDEGYYLGLREKARVIYNAKIPPPRIHASPIWFQCRMCKFNKVCHNGV